jgi:uncharacterized RmlC-like cupin family protein
MPHSDPPAVVVLSPKAAQEVRQGMAQFQGISGATAGATGLSMNLTAFGPGDKSKAHYHRGFETAIWGVSGRIALYHGPALEHRSLIEPGTFVFIPAGVPHVAFNLSDVAPATAISARNDPAEQENVVLVPELDGRRDADAAALKADLAAGLAEDAA